MDEFWAVWIEGKGFENELHEDKDKAIYKAETLSVINNSLCYVLKTVGSTKPMLIIKNGEFVEI